MSIKRKIIRAFQQLIARDSYLLTVDANERSITHQLAIYLQNEFPEYHVDCEYNRQIGGTKRLSSFRKEIQSDNINGPTVYPDIIVHLRGTSVNFIVIEAKKDGTIDPCSNLESCRCDLCKLIAYKQDLQYRHAFFIKFPMDAPVNLTSETLENFIEEI